MLKEIRKHLLSKPDREYLEWIFPRSKQTLITGLTFTFISVTALSIANLFYHQEELQAPGAFDADEYFRLIPIPIINLIAIFLAKSKWNNSFRKSNWLAGIVIFTIALAFLVSGLFNKYYSAVEDFSYDTLVLILFIQTLFGLTFRTSFLFNLVLMMLTLTYMTIDNDSLKEYMWTATLILFVWVPVVIGILKLEESKYTNFKTISQLEKAKLELDKQKKLLRAGEEVSKLTSWNTSKDLKSVNYSEGVYSIYEFDRDKVHNEDIFTKTLACIHPKDKKEVLSHLENIKNGNSAQYYEHRIISKTGKLKWLGITIGEFIEGEGYYGTIQDITKEKNLKLELQAQARELKVKNQDLQQFAFASSHDLQEPLRTISNFVSVLDKKLKGQISDEHKLYMSLIISSTERMKALILAILEYSRIGRNKNIECFDCNKVVSDVLADLNFAIEESKGKIHIDTLPTITGYKAELTTLIQNLISNALKFRKENTPPEINIRSVDTKDHFHFSVQDNGIGIDKKHENKIFQLFSRLHSNDHYNGTGIGLTHSKKIVELHGGKIWVESEPNIGTTFHFTISKKITEKTA